MANRRTLKIFLFILAVYILVWVPYVLLRDVLPDFLAAAYAVIGFLQVIPIYVFGNIGIPGLLVNDGSCGWSWCGPTSFGYVLLSIFWSLVAWLVSLFTCHLTKRSSEQ